MLPILDLQAVPFEHRHVELAVMENLGVWAGQQLSKKVMRLAIVRFAKAGVAIPRIPNTLDDFGMLTSRLDIKSKWR